MIFDLSKVNEAVTSTLPVVALVDFVELDAQLHLHPIVEFLLTLKLRL